MVPTKTRKTGQSVVAGCDVCTYGMNGRGVLRDTKVSAIRRKGRHFIKNLGVAMRCRFGMSQRTRKPEQKTRMQVVLYKASRMCGVTIYWKNRMGNKGQCRGGVYRGENERDTETVRACDARMIPKGVRDIRRRCRRHESVQERWEIAFYRSV